MTDKPESASARQEQSEQWKRDERPGRKKEDGPAVSGAAVRGEGRIAACEAAHHEAVCELLACSFGGKFRSLVRLNDRRTARLIAAAWPFRQEEGSRQFGFFLPDSGQPVGTVALKWTPTGKSSAGGGKEPDWVRLMFEFGPLNVLKFAAGMAALGYTPPEEECYIEHIAVRPDCRGKGIGRALLGHAARFARESGFGSLSLHVSGRSPATIRLYENAGFRTVRVERRPLGRFFFREPLWHFMCRPADGR
ncbi:GNAT family N-acetyltransferase [Saccharibacillus alkalitolerans]|uniref:GNAT family N-acetyltransferase n=1 Tax=Saccharibacillus alkalitolerans TaxID=2705290 RepID=A0ABX0F6Z8_9BACL|nr:GNAT family N-acetyltransferase [Saccharibacillus alkalitolerans]NGZ75774.1 GNAT family N-acetyltransferase [Saccharibacillus alkalitolerans]